MISLPSPSLRSRRAAQGMRWLMVVVFLFGAVVSSVGGIVSHGVAAIKAADHAAPTSSNPSHGHAHALEEGEWPIAGDDAIADHSHHGVDHSHDKAHDLPTAGIPAGSPLARWFGSVRPWVETVRASRLERPPMG